MEKKYMLVKKIDLLSHLAVTVVGLFEFLDCNGLFCSLYKALINRTIGSFTYLADVLVILRNRGLGSDRSVPRELKLKPLKTDIFS